MDTTKTIPVSFPMSYSFLLVVIYDGVRTLIYLLLVSENDNNFALEYYGKGSKCLDHTNMAWEERTCRLSRQWHHWGSGCYKVYAYDWNIILFYVSITSVCSVEKYCSLNLLTTQILFLNCHFLAVAMHCLDQALYHMYIDVQALEKLQ